MRTLGRPTAVFGLVVATSTLFLGCGGSETARPPSTATTATRPASTTSPTATTTGEAHCASPGGVAEVRTAFPDAMSSLVGKDVRTGGHRCFERLVVELQPGTGAAAPTFPGYWVRYATGPVVLSPKGEPVTLRGGAVLLVSMASAMSWASNVGYQGPTDLFPANVVTIRELRLVEDFEGQSTWAVGLDRVRGFTVAVLGAPARLVIDIAT
jgi:hypothetical protein